MELLKIFSQIFKDFFILQFFTRKHLNNRYNIEKKMENKQKFKNIGK